MSEVDAIYVPKPGTYHLRLLSAEFRLSLARGTPLIKTQWWGAGRILYWFLTRGYMLDNLVNALRMPPPRLSLARNLPETWDDVMQAYVQRLLAHGLGQVVLGELGRKRLRTEYIELHRAKPLFMAFLYGPTTGDDIQYFIKGVHRCH